MDKGDQMDDGRTRWTGSCGQRTPMDKMDDTMYMKGGNEARD